MVLPLLAALAWPLALAQPRDHHLKFNDPPLDHLESKDLLLDHLDSVMLASGVRCLLKITVDTDGPKEERHQQDRIPTVHLNIKNGRRVVWIIVKCKR
jgi:hypothetical protein